MCGSTAVALNTCNGNLMMDYPAIDEINKITFVIAVDFKISGRFTNRTGFKFSFEKSHELLKNRF